MAAVSFGFLIFALVLAVLVTGIALIVLGIRGTPQLSEPRCAKCGYDLRVLNFASPDPKRCPECGLDLNAPAAVSFGRHQKRPVKITIGLILILLTLVLPFAFILLARSVSSSVAMSGPSANANKSTPTLLAGLPATVATPWDWQELERRLKAGKLTRQDVDAAFVVLTTHLNAERAAGKPQEPLHWSGKFVGLAIQNNQVTPDKLQALCQAFYRDGLEVRTPSAARAGQEIRVEITQSSTPWALDQYPLAWSLKKIVTDDSQELQPTTPQYGGSKIKSPDQFSGISRIMRDQDLRLAHRLTPGDHELTFVFDMGLLSGDAVLRGLDGRPGSADKWPNPVAKWETTLKRKVRIVGSDQPTVSLVTDPASNPFTTQPLTIKEALIRPASNGYQIVIRWNEFNSSLPLGYTITAVAGQRRLPCGQYVRVQQPNNSMSSITGESHFTIQLPPDIRTINLILTPDPKLVEQWISIDRIWGQPLEINNVPLGRYDLQR